MKLIAIFLTKMILIRFGAILFGLSAFVLTLEVVSFLTEIAKIESNTLYSVAMYCFMRLPAIITLFLPTSLLLGLLLTITELSYRNELTAIWATGVSPSGVIVMLLPMAILLGGFQYLIADQAIPTAAPILRKWGIGDYAARKLSTDINQPVWIRSGDDVMRADHVTSDGQTLDGLILFRREASGQLKEQLFATSAFQKEGRWLLNDVTIYYSTGERPTHLAQMVYDGEMRLASNKIASPEEMTLQELGTFVANNGFGVRPAYVYDTWWHKRLTPILTAIVMIALCIPLGTRFRRGGGLGLIFAAGVSLGFVYFVGDGIAMTMGEAGTVRPWMAAWGPLLIFAALAVVMLTRTDQA
jgi:lipopolysaccharide export system permease protein